MTNGSDPGHVRQRWLLGDEIGAHAVDHLNQMDPAVGEALMRREIVGSREWVVKEAKVPESHVLGYRTPLLAESAEQRQLLAETGFLYDSSIVETPKSVGQGSRVWPYRMDAGIPQNRHRIKRGTEAEERHGLWEVPVWVLLHEGRRYCMDPGRGGEGNDEEGDPFEILRSNFDAAYKGNRAPLPFFVHVFWFNKEREKRAKKFIEYALSKPGVYFVTMQTLLAWMQNPVPVDKMNAWLAQRCSNPGSGGARKGSKTSVVSNSGQETGASSGSSLNFGSVTMVAGSCAAVWTILFRRRRARRAGGHQPLNRNVAWFK